MADHDLPAIMNIEMIDGNTYEFSDNRVLLTMQVASYLVF